MFRRFEDIHVYMLWLARRIQPPCRVNLVVCMFPCSCLPEFAAARDRRDATRLNLYLDLHELDVMSDRTSLDKKTTAVLEVAQRLQDTLAKADLNIVEAQKQFDIRTTTTNENIKLPLAFAENGGLVDPASIPLDLTSQLVRAPLALCRVDADASSASVGLLPEAEVPIPGAEGEGFIRQDHSQRRRS